MKRITLIFVFFLSWSPFAKGDEAGQDPVIKNEQKLEDVIAKINQGDPEKIINEVLLPFLENNPNHINTLNSLALLMFAKKDFDAAKIYIDRSLKVEKSDRTLEIFAMIYVSKKEFKALEERLTDLEGMKVKSPFIITTLLVFVEKTGDMDLYLRTIGYLDDSNINGVILNDLKMIGKQLLDERSKAKLKAEK